MTWGRFKELKHLKNRLGVSSYYEEGKMAHNTGNILEGWVDL